MADHRYQRTDVDIQNAFLHLVDRMPYEQVTVAQVVEEAMITRTTFYNHYQDLPTLATQMIHALLAEFAEVLNKRFTLAPDTGNVHQIITSLLPEVQQVVLTQREKTRVLRKITVGGLTIDRGIHQIVQQITHQGLRDESGTYEQAILNAILATGLDHFLDTGELPSMTSIQTSLQNIAALILPSDV
jgi:AcrR family transcriptional regulator